jgi:hypothetical protein
VTAIDQSPEIVKLPDPPNCDDAEHRASDWATADSRHWFCGICAPPSWRWLVRRGLAIRREPNYALNLTETRRDDSHMITATDEATASLRLTTGQARALTDEVRADAAALWTKLWALYKGDAHISLGYSSWAEYCAEEFDFSKSRAYQLLDAGRVIEQIIDSTIVDRPGSEAVARELAPVLRDDPDRVPEVWGEVVDEHGPKPTAAQVHAHVRSKAEANTGRKRLDVAARKRRGAERAAQRLWLLVSDCAVKGNNELVGDLCQQFRLDEAAKCLSDDDIGRMITELGAGIAAYRKLRQDLRGLLEERRAAAA